jgi:AcrR family transcriptional regulator
MRNGAPQRKVLLEKIADHLLAQGLEGASLRPLAAAAGTSDRMLLYYFADKDALLTAALNLIVERLQEVLSQGTHEEMPFSLLIPHLAQVIRDPHIRPYLRLWLELMTFAARNEEPFTMIARQISDDFLTWFSSMLMIEMEEDRIPLAALAMAIVDGLILFDTIGADMKIQNALAGISLRK